jgi:hypothetical protein
VPVEAADAETDLARQPTGLLLQVLVERAGERGFTGFAVRRRSKAEASRSSEIRAACGKEFDMPPFCLNQRRRNG